MNKIISFLKSKKFIFLAIVVLAGGGWWFFKEPSGPAFSTVEAKQGTIIQEVSVTGKTKPVKAADLAFDRVGKINNVYVEVGDRVKSGQALLSVDSSDLSAQLSQAQATIDSQKARLEELKNGPRPEDIAVSKTEVAKAEQDLNNAYRNVTTVLSDVYSKADDSVRKQTDALFLNDENQPSLTFQTGMSQNRINAETARRAASLSLDELKNENNSLSPLSPTTELDKALENNAEHMTELLRFLTYVMDAVSDNINLSPDTASGYKTSISTARTSVNGALSAVTAQQQTISAQKILLQRAKDALALKEAGSSAESIASQQALVRQAQAGAESILSSLEKTTLRSPINGIITRQDGKRGEIASVNTPIISVISDSNLEIESNVPEVDIGKIAPGNPVEITLDAFPGEKFSGKVASIEPAETIVDGVVNYKIKVAFDKEDARVKSGLTANLSIRTLEKQNVLIIPSYAVFEKEGSTFVRVAKGATETEDIKVVLGIRGRDGSVEVLSGISSGQQVVNIGLKTDK